MLTLQKCREILGTDYELSEQELESLRNDLYMLAEVAIDEFIKLKESKVKP